MKWSKIYKTEKEIKKRDFCKAQNKYKNEICKCT